MTGVLWDVRTQQAVNVTNPDELHAHWVAFLRDRRGGLEPIPDARVVEIGANFGAWVGICPHCNGGIACPPLDWPDPHGCCLTCGKVYALTVPDAKTAARVEKILAARPQHAQNWDPGDDFARMERENTLMADLGEPIAGGEPTESEPEWATRDLDRDLALAVAAHLGTGYTIRHNDETLIDELEAVGRHDAALDKAVKAAKPLPKADLDRALARLAWNPGDPPLDEAG